MLRVSGLPQQPGLRQTALRHEEGPIGRSPRSRQYGHRVPRFEGNFRGRHYDRVEDHSDHYVIRPTIDRAFKPGEFSTISDHKDNVHWFTAESETGFIFNVHVVETNPENTKRPGRVYVDPMGEKLAGGLIKAPKISYGKVNQLYG